MVIALVSWKMIWGTIDRLSCTLDYIQVHKVILSACSNFFKSLLRRNPHNHPLLYLKGVKYSDLLCVLNFMYHGEVNVAQEDLNSFLAVAEDLQVKGLTQGPSSAGSRESQASLDQKPPSRPRPPPQNAPVKKVQPVPPQVVPPVDDDVQEVAAPMVKVEPVHPQDQGAGNQQQQQGQYNEGVLQLLQYEQGEYDEKTVGTSEGVDTEATCWRQPQQTKIISVATSAIRLLKLFHPTDATSETIMVMKTHSTSASIARRCFEPREY